MDNQPKRIIVKFKPIPRGAGTTLEDLCQQVLASIPGSRLVRPASPSGRAVFQLGPNADVEALIGQLSRLDSIEYAEPDVIDRSA